MQLFKTNQSIIFPSRLIDDSYEEKEVLEELMKLQINSRKSATNLKRLLKERSRMDDEIKGSINVHNLAILKGALPPKEKDPMSFTIPCNINNICFEKALANLGASISVMPYSTFTNLGLGELAPTKLIIELVDRTIKHPKGLAENVLLEIDKFVFPIDFIVLDMPEDIKNPLILGRPFLSIAHAKIDVFKKKIALRVGNDKIVFKSDNPTSNIIKRVYISQDLEFGYFLELNNLNEPLELRRNQDVDDLGLTIEEGKVIDEPMVDIVKTRHDNEIIEGIDEYPNKVKYKGKNVVGAFINVPIFVGNFSVLTDFTVVENIDAYRDKDMGDVIVGKPFCRASCVQARWFNRFITIYNGNENVTYQMARSHPRFKHLTNAQCNKIRPLLKVSAHDKLEGISHPYQKLKGFYKGVLNLGPKCIKDDKMVE
ncbi:hypothetical protein Tco_0953234 [Tanacetum coccineum]|uniref:Uncharacterized protein n=1 Tax=Tanacetum coccineum TaxID=301880 RepID=A0ABQ5E3X8_9ASTR